MNAYFESLEAILTWGDVTLIDRSLSKKSTDAQLAARGLFRIWYAPMPTPGAYQGVQEILPEKVNGKYYSRYRVFDLFPADIVDPDTGAVITVQQQKDRYDAGILEQQKASVNARRSALLEQYVAPYTSDLLVWGDLTPEQQQQVRSYRADLLAVEQQSGYPNTVVWPTPPQFN